jgi:predicted MFS family arabinose efflux permease
VLIGVTTAAGIGIGYPLVGLLAQGLGLYAPFWFAAGRSALALAAALVTLPDSPARPARVDVAGAVLLGAGIAVTYIWQQVFWWGAMVFGGTDKETLQLNEDTGTYRPAASVSLHR